MDAELVPLVVPGASVPELVALLEEWHLVGSVIDGRALGIDDVVVARLAGELVGEESLLSVVEDSADPVRISEVVVLDQVRARWPDAVIGDAAVDAYEIDWPVMKVAELRTVAVTPPAELMLSIFAKAAEVTLHEARVGDRLLVGIEEGHQMAVDLLVDALANAKGRSVVLWRTGGHTAFYVMKRGKVAAAHLWEPVWTPFGHPDLDDLRDPGLSGDAAVIGSLLDLDAPSVVALRAMLRRPVPDLEALAGLLGLPAEMVDVLEGRATVSDLPGGTVPEPLSWRQEAVRLAAGSEHDPAWMRWFDAGARELRPWYLVSSLVSILVGVLLLTEWATGGSVIWDVLGVVLVLGTVVDLSVRWWLRRRRA